MLFNIKQNINPHLIALLLTNYFIQYFDYSNKITWERIKDLTLEITEEDIKEYNNYKQYLNFGNEFLIKKTKEGNILLSLA